MLLPERLCLLLGLSCFDDIVGNMLGRMLAISSVAAVVVLAVLLNTTTPASAGPLWILVVFILMYVSTLGVLTFLIYGLNRLIVRMSSSMAAHRPAELLGMRKSYYYSSVISLAPVMIIGMQSVNEVGVYDILLVGLFIAIACVYVAKRAN